MSWLARSIANSLKLDDGAGDDFSIAKPESKQLDDQLLQNDDSESPTSPSRGVKDDLSDLSKNLTRQFWGVASFLAPPPQQPRSDPDSDLDMISGIRSDFAEIGGKFRSGISRLSNNINVSEITKIASDFLQLGSDDEAEEEAKREGFDSVREGAAGVTEEVLAFARDIAMHPQTWLDFPLPENVDDDADFDMSDVQQKHALAVERLAPCLAALRFEICPEYISENHFWKIYFVLLHPRLDSNDAELLSTPQILKARDFLAQELRNQTSTKELHASEENSVNPDIGFGSQNEEPLSVASSVISVNDTNKPSSMPVESETAKNQVVSDETQIDEKPMTNRKDVTEAKDQNMKSNFSNVLVEKDEDDADDWLKEDNSEIFAVSGTVPIENEDEVSFSDLEDDDADAPGSFRKSDNSFKKYSPEWVQLRKSSDSSEVVNETAHTHDAKESNDWLDIDDIDVA